MLRLFARVRTFGVATSLAIASLGIVAPVPASAQTTPNNWQILVGPDTQATGLARFYPSEVTVHPGDTVEYDWMGFHTVTFNPPGNLWLFDFLGFNGPVGGSSLDTPTSFVNGNPGFPGGGPPPPFVVTIGSNLPTGSYKFTCRIHQFMHGVINVTNGELPSTNDQNLALAHAQIAADVAKATALDARVTRQTANREGEAVAGLSDRVAEFVKFYPSQITVRAGDELTFTDRDIQEPHTVTFGPIAGNPFDPSFGVFPAGPGNPNAFDGTSALNSGFLYYESQYDYWNLKVSPISSSVPRKEFSVTFTTPGKYNFYCAIHGFRDPQTGAVFGMSGSVTVLPKETDNHSG